MTTVKNLLMPGGLGFVGSNCLVEILLHTKTKVIIIDNLSNCFDDVLERVQKIVS